MKPTFLLILCLCLTVMLQAQVSKTINISVAGSLSTALTSTEKNTVTNLTLTGTIDARDFKTMRDDMPVLAVIDLSGSKISAFEDYNSYTVSLGTSSPHTSYLANKIPQNAFYNLYSHESKESLTTVIFPTEVTIVGKSAFEDCENLTSVSFSSNITSIEESAFAYCEGLTTINLPLSLKTIGRETFGGCDGLESITIPSYVTTISDYAFAYCSYLLSVTIPSSVTYIGRGAFEECPCLIELEGNNPNYTVVDDVLFNKNLTALIKCPATKTGSYFIPSTVDTIKDYAFTNCKKISAVTIPSSVKIIGEGAFQYCEAIVSVTIAPSVETIEESAFLGCESLTSVIIPPSVTLLGCSAFEDCTSLSAISIPSSVTILNDDIFAGCGLKSIIIPSSVTKIGESAFEDCDSLGAVIIPSSVTEINDYAFQSCNNLSSITIPSTVTYIGQAVLEECPCSIILDQNNKNYAVFDNVLFTKDQTELISCSARNSGDYMIPPTVTYINTGAFCGCNKLTSVSIPASVKEMGYRVFQFCSKLTSVYTYSQIPIDIRDVNSVFEEVDFSQCTLYVPAGSKATYQLADQWKDFTSIQEMFILMVSTNIASISSTGVTSVSVTVSTTTSWIVNSDQTWLKVNPSSGTGNGTLTFTASENPNTTTRKATVTVSASGVASQIITITQEAGIETGVSNFANEIVKLFPNPVTKGFYVSGIEGNATIEIFDLSGKICFSKEFAENEYLPINSLQQGIYIVQVSTTKGDIIKKLVKK